MSGKQCGAPAGSGRGSALSGVGRGLGVGWFGPAAGWGSVLAGGPQQHGEGVELVGGEGPGRGDLVHDSGHENRIAQQRAQCRHRWTVSRAGPGERFDPRPHHLPG